MEALAKPNQSLINDYLKKILKNIIREIRSGQVKQYYLHLNYIGRSYNTDENITYYLVVYSLVTLLMDSHDRLYNISVVARISI